MALTKGTQLDSYEILEQIGAGGMGEVYRGRDTKLGRDVAVKALPDIFANSPDRLARFEREAQVLAALKHPNLGIIHELKEVNGSQYLILELIEGETLAARIARGPIPLDQALDIAKQIADALEAAHEKGIVHRDLKPANVKITPEGRVKVLDFGLAKIYEPAVTPQNLSHSPTLGAGQTEGGMILGTAAYMSPEQARGQEVDRRTDVWAFGCVLYEMLTGRQTFPNGETVSDTLAGILAREPGWQVLPPTVPSRIRSLLERCLRKDARRRWSGMSDVRTELEEARGEREASAIIAATPARSRRRECVLAAAALLFLVITAGVAWRFLLAAPPEAIALRSEFWVPPNSILGSLGTAEISPDGRSLAFVVTADNKRLIWVRPLDSTAAQPLPGTEGINGELFWSADSQYIAFGAEGKLKKVAAGGGPSQIVTNLPSNGVHGGTWNTQDLILLGAQTGPLLRVSGSAGAASPATELDVSRKETAHGYPSFLPDGRHFLFLVQSSDPQNRSAAYIGELDSKQRRPLPGIGSRVLYSPSGHLVFIRDGALMAQPFDLKRLETAGGAFPLADPFVGAAALTGPFSVSAAAAASLAYSRPVSLTSLIPPNSQLAWMDRTGKQLGLAGPEGPYATSLVASLSTGLSDLRFGGPAELSPDGRFVAFSRDNPPDIWVLDIEKGLTSRLTSSPAADSYPVWSPDSKKVAFRSERDGAGNIYVRGVDDVGEEKPLFQDDASKFPTDWTADGRFLIYHTADGDIWALPMSGANASPIGRSNQGISGEQADRKPVRITQTPFFESDARVSPDGHWIAYLSNEPGHVEVYVQSFPQPGFKQPVSSGGGFMARWSPDGKELFYDVVGTLMSVSVKPLGSSIQISAPASVFPLRGPMHGVTKSGRFLAMIITVGRGGGPGILLPDNVVVVHNWAATKTAGAH